MAHHPPPDSTQRITSMRSITGSYILKIIIKNTSRQMCKGVIIKGMLENQKEDYGELNC